MCPVRQKDKIYSDVEHFANSFNRDEIYTFIENSNADPNRLYLNSDNFDNEYNLAFASEISDNFDVSQMQACVVIFDYYYNLLTLEKKNE